VLGVDVSEPMLAVSRERAAGLANVGFLAADAQTHAFEPVTYDLVMSRFGVMFFDDPARAFASLRRALRPGGRLCFVCWGPSAENPWFDIPIQVAARHLGPPDPVPPRKPGPMSLSEPDYVTELLQAAGFAHIAITPEHPAVLGHATPAEEAHFSTLAGPLTRLLAAKQPDAATLAALVSDMAKALEPFATPAGVRLPSTVFVVTAKAP
jgi:SAM-dependent methyltransferase